MKLVEKLLNLLYPPKCVFCGGLLRRGEEQACADCLRRLPVYTTAPRTVEFCKHCVAPFYYEAPVRDSLLRFKFGGRSFYAEAYAAYLAAAINAKLSGEYNLLTWVPVSGKRRRQRGYDQARLLAEAVGKRLNLAPEATLRKCRDNPPQSGQTSAAARRANVLGAYEVLNPALVAGRKILILDDIVTTGATIAECARVLRTAGAEQVVCAAVASTQEK